MLSKKNRLSTRLFQEVFQKGKNFNSPNFVLKITPSLEKGNKISFVVSKKVANKAVLRNRLRRRAYAAAKNFIKTKSPFKAVFVIKKDFSKVPIGEVEKEIESLLKKSFAV